MMKKHLSLDDLARWLDEWPDCADPQLEFHIRHCAECSSAVANARLLDCLIRWQPTRVGEPHLSAELLATYAEEGLEEQEMREVMDHLVGCDECLIGLIELRYALATDGKEFGAEALADSLGPRLRQWIGQLRISFVEGIPQLQFHAMPWATIPSTTLHEPAPYPSKSPPPKLQKLLMDQPAMGKIGSPGQQDLLATLSAGRFTITAAVTGNSVDDLMLHLEAVEKGSGYPVARLPLKMISKNGESELLSFDENGRLNLPVKPGQSELEVGQAPVHRALLDVSDSK